MAAVCVYGDLAGVAREALAGTGIHVAAVATAFPSGRASRAVKLADVKDAVANGADEIDMVIDRGAFLTGRYLDVYEEIVAVKEACGDAHLKVILETGELVTLDNVRRASWLAMLAGGDFIKTSTGKISPAATLPVCLVMLEAVRDFRAATGRRSASSPPAASGRRRTRSSTWCWSTRPSGPTGSPPTGSASAPPACSTTSCCSGRSSAPATTPAPTT